MGTPILLGQLIAGSGSDAQAVKLTGAQEIAGVKAFLDPPQVPAGAFSIDRIAGLAAALAAKASTASPAFTGTPTGITKSHVGLPNVDNTADANKPVSAAAQAALDAKVPATRTVAGKSLTGDVTLVKADVGLANVDNTADAAKPVSSAQQTALDAKVPATRTVAGKALTADVTLAKADVGLSNVDNTTDAGKPVSTAQAAALALKAAQTDFVALKVRVDAAEPFVTPKIYSATRPDPWPAGYDWEMVVTGPPADTTPPPAPVLNTIALTDEKPTLTWNLVTDASGRSAHKIYRRVGASGAFALLDVVGANTSTYIDAGVTPGVTYNYVVTALDASLNSNESATSNIGTVDVPAANFMTRADKLYDLDPNPLTAANGSLITAFPSVGGTIPTLTLVPPSDGSAVGVTLVHDALDGRKSVRAVAASTHSLQQAFATVTGDVTLIAVVKCATPDTTSIRYFSSGISSSAFRGLAISGGNSTSAKMRVGAGGTNNFVTSVNAYSQDNWRILVAVIKASDGSVRFYDHSKTAQTLTLPGGASTMGSVRLFRGAGNSTAFMNGEIARQWAFNAEFTEGEVDAAIDYIADTLFPSLTPAA